MMAGSTMRARHETGFTLLELLTIIIIIGILAAIAIPLFQSQRARAQDALAIAEARNTYAAVESVIASTPGGYLPSLPNTRQFADDVLASGSTAKTGDSNYTKITFINGGYYVSTWNPNGAATSCGAGLDSNSTFIMSGMEPGSPCNESAVFSRIGTVGDLSHLAIPASLEYCNLLCLDAPWISVPNP